MHQNLVEVYVYVILFFQYLTALRKAKLVSLFKLSIVLPLLLHCVVCQVDHGLVDELLSQAEPMGACANITFFEQVAAHVADLSQVDHHPQPDVELSLIDQQGSFYILLDDEHL